MSRAVYAGRDEQHSDYMVDWDPFLMRAAPSSELVAWMKTNQEEQ